jgi:lipopolysaccharide transport system permease protein
MTEAVLPEPPHVTIRPSKGLVALRLGEVWQFRDLLFSLAKRDLKLRYKQTAIGVAWVALQPLMGAGVFAFVFGSVAGMSAPGQLSYFLFSYAGLLGWNVFSGTLSKVGGSLVGNSHLISKVFFPRLVLPLSILPSTLLDFAVASVMLVALMIWFAQPPFWGLVLLPVWMAMLLALAMAIGLTISALAVWYRDVIYVMPVILQIVLYASPVAYGVERVPEHLRFWYFLNPVSAPLQAFRWSILGVGELPMQELAISAGISAALLVFGVVNFKRMERRFADII